MIRLLSKFNIFNCIGKFSGASSILRILLQEKFNSSSCNKFFRNGISDIKLPVRLIFLRLVQIFK